MNETSPLPKLPAHRKRWNRIERLQWLQAYEDSGLRSEEFCRQHSLPPSRIDNWLKKENKRVRAIRFKEVALPVVEKNEPVVAVEISSPSGICTRIFQGCDRELITQIFQAVYPCGR